MLIVEILFFGPLHFLLSFIFLEILLVLNGRENPIFEGKERNRTVFLPDSAGERLSDLLSRKESIPTLEQDLALWAQGAWSLRMEGPSHTRCDTQTAFSFQGQCG